MTDLVLKSIRKGKTNEQLLACDVLMLTFVQFGLLNSDVITTLNDSKKILLDLIEDEKVEPEVRAACVKAFGFGIFCANENSAEGITILDKLEGIFSQSYAKGDGTLRNFTPKVYELHAAALSTWCLLLCTMPLQFVNKLGAK